MRILIVSDSHGRRYYLERAIHRVGTIDLLFHLGDLEGDEEYLHTNLLCPVKMVAGNNDYFTNVPREEWVTLGKYNIMMTHGHRYGVNYELEQLKETAKGRGANIVMFGHTHRPIIDLSNDSIWAINPGSISQPRQEGRLPSFILMEIDQQGEAHFALNYMED